MTLISLHAKESQPLRREREEEEQEEEEEEEQEEQEEEEEGARKSYQCKLKQRRTTQPAH